jgi:hypothetical protein
LAGNPFYFISGLGDFATWDPQSVTVRPEFLEPGAEYKFEVLAIEAGGNQTITEGGPS